MTDKQMLQEILLQSPAIHQLLDDLKRVPLPGLYLGAGCIAQTVWNHLHGFSYDHGIDDADIVYFDDVDLSEQGEEAALRAVQDALSHPVYRLDVKNEARVHLWYERKFGYAIAPYTSCEHAIDSWPTTATAIGIRPIAGGMQVYAPYGLEDLMGGIVRANKAQITEEIYQKKTEKWRAKWPRLTILPW